MGLEYGLRRRGPLTMAPSQLGAFTRSSSEYETPNLQYHIQPLSLDRFGEPMHPFRPSPPASPICARPAAARSMRGRAMRTTRR